MNTADFTIGVEEEFLVVDGVTGALRSDGLALLPAAQDRLGDDVQAELHPSQLETNTSVAATLGDVRSALVRLRSELGAAVAEAGCRLAATGTHPFSAWTEDPEVSPEYEIVEEEYQQLAREQVICGLHVHVGIEDPELAIAVVNRVGPWLSPIVALAANSPFWGGRDTGYASYRTELWRRWPMAGTPAPFAGRAEYEAVVEALFRTGSIDDHARIYWDVRPSAKFPTVEFRVADVGMTVDESVMVAGLVRALAVTAARDAEASGATPAAVPRPELLRAATWRAARYGLSGGTARPGGHQRHAGPGTHRPVPGAAPAGPGRSRRLGRGIRPGRAGPGRRQWRRPAAPRPGGHRGPGGRRRLHRGGDRPDPGRGPRRGRTERMTADAVPLVPREVLFGNPEKVQPRISPDGKRLAYIAPLNGVLNVWLGDIGAPEDTFKAVTNDTDRGHPGLLLGAGQRPDPLRPGRGRRRELASLRRRAGDGHDP